VKRRSLSRTAAALITATLVFTACTSDDDSGDEVETSDAPTETTGEETATETTQASGDESATETTEATAEESMEESTDESTTETTEATGDAGTGEEMAGDVGTVGGSGCGTPHGPYEAAEAAGEVRAAWNDPLLSFNNNTTHANATANANVAYLMHSGFIYYDGDLNLVNNDSFGTCTVESLDPLTVTYTINEGVTWSDGTPVDAADMLLYWAALSGKYNDGNAAFLADGTAIQTDDEGNWLVREGADGEPRAETAEDYDATTGELLEGLEYIPAEGVQFDGSSEAYELVTETPTLSEDGRSITLKYDSFYVDYQNVPPFGGDSAATHVVGKNALGIEDPMEAKQAVIDAIVNEDGAALAPIAEFWSSAFDQTSLPDDPELYLSTGMYLVTAYEELSEITFEVNPNYSWGPMPKVETIVYRIIGDPTAAVQALANEEIDVMQPQATADILTQLEEYADRGIEVVTGDTGTYEHVDLVFDNGGPFDPATYGGDEATALAVRQALLKTLPRGDFIDRLIAPLNPEATTRDSFTQVVGSPPYENLATNNGMADYAEVDIEGAIALLEEAGVTTPIDVRVHFADNNPRRASEYELMAASAAEAGFNLIDGRSATWGPELSDNSIYDMSLFGWQSTAVAVADTEANFVTGGQNNYGHYSNPDVDALYEELKATSDADRQQEILLEIEQNLVTDGFGVPLFQHPGVTAFNSNYVTGINPIPLSPTMFWNVWDWEAA
jgi:peptide/nickel transport system substrate-binding protein